MSTNVNAPKNLAETTAMLIAIIPSGCYAELLGSWVWVEQVGNDEFTVFSIPKGESISDLNLSAWEDFDEEHGWITIDSIKSWMARPVFGLLRTIEGFDIYPRKIFVVSNTGPRTIQQHEEWKSWVMKMYACVRKHDSNIPDMALDAMRDLLLQK